MLSIVSCAEPAGACVSASVQTNTATKASVSMNLRPDLCRVRTADSTILNFSFAFTAPPS